MAYDLKNRLVIGLSSSALFDLSESDKVFRDKGEKFYRLYQRQKQDEVLEKGRAFNFIWRLLSLNVISPESPLVEVILLSKNDPDTGLRVMNSIKYYGLDITRAVFLQGGFPHRYISAFNISLFLSASESDVKLAVDSGLPAGQVLNNRPRLFQDDEGDELRIAFDFDGVIADDESKLVFRKYGLDAFQENEASKVDIVHQPGLLKTLLDKLSKIQRYEQKYAVKNPNYTKKIRISIVTARNAPAHERVIKTMRSWGITVNEAFFLGGVEKNAVLEVLRPHIFFDDQLTHANPASEIVPAVHIPFGIANQSIRTE